MIKNSNYKLIYIIYRMVKLEPINKSKDSDIDSH